MVVANAADKEAERRFKQRDQPVGRVYASPDLDLEVWALPWGKVLAECEGRMKFFQESLKYEASEKSGVDYLNRMHAGYFPETEKLTKGGRKPAKL